MQVILNNAGTMIVSVPRQNAADRSISKLNRAKTKLVITFLDSRESFCAMNTMDMFRAHRLVLQKRGVICPLKRTVTLDEVALKGLTLSHNEVAVVHIDPSVYWGSSRLAGMIRNP